MDKDSLTPQEIKLQELKAILPEVFTEGKIDWEKLKAALGEQINFSNERYVLNWAGKSEAFEILQKPSSQTLIPAKEESVNFDQTKNLFIEGENLEVLKILQKSYFGKVKIIYIDPPYNTGNDSFIYPDKFSETTREYAQRVGDKDEEGYLTKNGAFIGVFRKNSKENGQYHSNWLNMMMPRLYLARNLLSDDGVIFVSIDDNEQANLKFLMDEVFGEENFVAKFIHKNNSNKNQSKLVSITTEYFLAYAKNKLTLKNIEWRIAKKGVKEIVSMFEKLKSQNMELDEILLNIKEMYKMPKYAHLSRWNKIDEKGVFKDADLSREGGRKDYTIINKLTQKQCVIPSRGWGKSLKELHRLQEEDLIWYGEEDTPPGLKDYILKDDVTVPDNVWYIDSSTDTRFIKEIFNGLVFENPKSLEMIKGILGLNPIKDGLILDFFSGSGTTAHAVMQLNAEDGGNRQCISVQLPEPCDKDSEAYKAGFSTIAEVAKERIRRSGQKILEENKDKEEIDKLDIGFKVLKLTESNFKQWRTPQNTEQIGEQVALFVDALASETDTENIVYELLLKLGKDLNSQIVYQDGICSVNQNECIFLLEKVSEQLVDQVIALKPKKVIALDKLFKGNDQLKTNAVLQMNDANIQFHSI